MSTKAANAVRRRQPFASLDKAQTASVEIAGTSGWKVIEVLAGPGGPPRTRWGGVPPRVIALRPDGRRTTVGSWARWEALLAATERREQGGGAP